MAGEVVIRGPRLVLRPLRTAEIDAEWQAMVAADPISIGVLPDESAFRARLARSGQMRDGWLDLAIDLDGTSIGRIQTFVPPRRPLPPGTFDIGIELRSGVRGQGYGREALALFAGWLFEQRGAQVVEAGTDAANHAMRSVFGHVGWHEDGIITEIGRDWVMYRMTRADWEAGRAAR
ncbi:MAG TPA: GNAT family protein [Trebonia sp.]|jgi:RimJ/RimL family protein N-acetyltransferase|nr:GNAT family protein [Trebonia sp.]